MNGFDRIPGGRDGSPYTQYRRSDIPNYWRYAKTFTLADRMFSSMYGPTIPEHMYTVAATSGRIVSNRLEPRGPRDYCKDARERFERLRHHPKLMEWERKVRIARIKALLEQVQACVDVEHDLPGTRGARDLVEVLRLPEPVPQRDAGDRRDQEHGAVEERRDPG